MTILRRRSEHSDDNDERKLHPVHVATLKQLRDENEDQMHMNMNPKVRELAGARYRALDAVIRYVQGEQPYDELP